MFAAAAAPESAGRIAVGGGGRGDAQKSGKASGGRAEEAGIFQRGNRRIFARRFRQSVFHRNERTHSGGASGNRNGNRSGSGEVADSSGGRRKAERSAGGAGRISRTCH